MDSARQPRFVSRRTALAGLGAAGLGTALATVHSTAAQDSMTEQGSHPLVGTWIFDPIPDLPTFASYATFHADGTVYGLHTFAGPGIGTWASTGERSAEWSLKYLNTAGEVGVLEPGTVTVWGTIVVDSGSNEFSSESIVDFRDSEGAFLDQFPFSGHSTRMVIAPPPPPPATPEPATPES